MLKLHQRPPHQLLSPDLQSRSSDLLATFKLQTWPVPTTLHRDRPPTSLSLLLLLNSHLQICRVALRLFLELSRPANRLKADRLPTTPQILLVPTHLLLTRFPADCLQHWPEDRALFLWTETLISLTDLLWTFLWKKGSCPTKILMLLLPTYPDQTLSEEQLPHQMTTPLLGPRHNQWAKCRSTCLLTSGYVGRWASSTSLWWKDILHVVRKREVYSKTSLSDQPDLRPNGMVLFPTIRKVILELVKLCHHGMPTLPRSTVLIAA